MSDFLDQYGYCKENTVVLTDADSDDTHARRNLPTRDNIVGVVALHIRDLCV